MMARESNAAAAVVRCMATDTKHRWSNIPQFPRAYYEIDVSWWEVEHTLARWDDAYGLVLDPDYQRAHVWTREQQIAYVEYVLAGGEVGRTITWNCPTWRARTRAKQPMDLVDGKQRLQAVRSFLRGEIPAFGMTYEPGELIDPVRVGFRWRVCVLATREDVLRFYLNINAGGTPHTAEELDRVRALLDSEVTP